MKNNQLIKILNILQYALPAIIVIVGVVITTIQYFVNKSHPEWSAPAELTFINLAVYILIALAVFLVLHLILKKVNP